MEIVHRFSEFLNALAKAFSEFRQLFRAEDQDRQDENAENLRSIEHGKEGIHSTHYSPPGVKRQKRLPFRVPSSPQGALKREKPNHRGEADPLFRTFQ
jgi:hypothetical protein